MKMPGCNSPYLTCTNYYPCDKCPHGPDADYREQLKLMFDDDEEDAS